MIHIGRSFGGHPIEDDCPCPQEPCGLVDDQKVDPKCPEHAFEQAKTIRQAHGPSQCPGDRS